MTTLSEQAFYAEYLMKNSLDFIGVADENGVIIEYNPSALNAFGYTLEEIRKLEVSELYASQEDYQRVVSSLETTGQYRGEVKNKRKNGEEFICFLSANVRHDEKGKNIGVIWISRDITQEIRLSRELEIQNERNARLIEEFGSLSRIATSVTNGIVVTDPDGRMKWSNESFSRITGYSNSELIGFRASELFRIPHFYQKQFDDLVKDGPIIKDSIQVPHYRKNGELYWILVESTPVYDENGKLFEVIEICTEITEQKNAEMALVESEANIRQMSETIEDVFFLYNVTEKRYEYISPNSTRMMGAEPEFFYQGKAYLNKFVHEEDRYMIRTGRLDLMNGRHYDIEYRIVLDGEERWLHERAFPILNEYDEIVKGAGVISDITQQKLDRALIDQQNQSIAESIHYAQHIQRSTLQEEQDVQRVFPESFLYYIPKGELSGDFYLADFMNTIDKKKLPVFVVADCTGHGVPGAILSILCTSLIRQTLSDRRVFSPGEALDLVRINLGKLFRSGESLQIKDGMDVGFGVVDVEAKQIQYSGAKMNAYILRDSKWTELKGSKQHVGFVENPVPFENVIFDYKEGDQLYLFTDGFVDQFGGSHNKKYLKRRLMDYIVSISEEPMEVQREMLRMEFLTWKGKEEQTDDICLFGIKF